MRSRKYFLVPGNNSLSHVAKCLVIRRALLDRGHEVRVAVNGKHSLFLKKLSIEHFVLPDIQESDDSGFPSVEWFRHPDDIAECVRQEVSLLKAFRPDRVLGVFRFTLKAAAKIAGVPFDSLVCGCMTPASGEILGFDENEPGRDIQRVVLDGFYRYAGRQANQAFASFGFDHAIGDIRETLLGERTFLWDFPEFSPVPETKGVIHVGPLSWKGWPYDPIDMGEVVSKEGPLAVVAFGTCTVNLPSVQRIITSLLALGFRVLVAGGGRKEFLNLAANPRVTTCTFAPLHEILPHASLLVTHGGQLTIFEGLQSQVPVVVMPFQPEQAHNGVCLERIGCGVRLIPPHVFQGDPAVYIRALEQMNDGEIESRITGLTDNPALKMRLERTRSILNRYKGVDTIADSLEEF